MFDLCKYAENLIFQTFLNKNIQPIKKIYICSARVGFLPSQWETGKYWVKLGKNGKKWKILGENGKNHPKKIGKKHFGFMNPICFIKNFPCI